MLSQVLDYIHNYFVKDVIRGKFEIKDGRISVPTYNMQVGQYFMIRGSIFSDGLHQYPVEGLPDEVFEGEVWAMAIPLEVIAIAAEVEDWVAKYGEVVNGPYTSESFGGYTYSKQTGAGGRSSSVFGWADVFRSRLNKWRKII